MKRRQLLPLVLFPSLAVIFILTAIIITDESPPPVTSAPSPLVKRNPTRSSAPRSTPPRSSPPSQARCFRTNYDSVCTEIASRNVASRGSVLITPTLKRLCVDNVNDMSTCMYPNTVQFDPPLLPLSLPELREALVAVGGPECVAGPLTLNDVVRTRYDGPGGVPRWSVYRKSCVGKYRDLTRQELLSVLYHYTQHMTSQGVPHAGFVLSGDSMIRSLVHRLVCFFRDVQHCVAMEFDIMYVLRADRDEVVMIHEKRERPHPMLDDHAKLLISLEHRCILAKYFPGFLPEAPPADKCWQHLEGVLVAFMVFWDPLPHKVHYELHKRMPPPPLMLTGFTYWWDRRDPNTPRYHFDTFQKFQEHRFAAFYGRKPSYPTVGEASPAKLPISMYITSPQLRRPHIDFIIPWVLLESRNEYIRHLPWQKVAHASIPAVNTGGVSPMHQYLLDFDILSRVLLNVSARSDEIHFLCGEDLFEVTEGFLCPDVIDGTMIQWIGHVIAGEL